MSTSLALAIYFVCWWIVLFAILPLRLGPQPSPDDHDPIADAAGAPHAPNMGRKFIVTTLVSGVIFAVIYAVFAFNLITIDSLR